MIDGVGYPAEQGAGIESRFDRRLWTPIGKGTLSRILTYSILQQDDAPSTACSQAQMIPGVSYPLPADAKGLLSDPRFAYLFNSHAGHADRKTDELNEASDHVDQTVH